MSARRSLSRLTGYSVRSEWSADSAPPCVRSLWAIHQLPPGRALHSPTRLVARGWCVVAREEGIRVNPRRMSGGVSPTPEVAVSESAGPGFHHADFVGEDHRLRAVADPELLEDVADVRLDRAFRQRSGTTAVVMTFGPGFAPSSTTRTIASRGGGTGCRRFTTSTGIAPLDASDIQGRGVKLAATRTTPTCLCCQPTPTCARAPRTSLHVAPIRCCCFSLMLVASAMSGR